MLTPSEKLSIVLKYKKLTTSEIAKKLDINRSAISQWKSDNSKFKKIHMYALSSAFNIPIEIFLDKSIDTEDKVISYLEQDHCVTSSEGKKLTDNFIGKWYLYFYSHVGNKLIEYEIDSLQNKQVIMKSDEAIYLGKLDSVQNHALIKSYCKKYNSSILIITFNMKRIPDGIFNVGILTKTLVSFRYVAALGIISKNRLDEEKVKYILGLKSENFLLNKAEKRDKIINILHNSYTQSIYDSNIIFNNLIGKWYFYRKNSTKEVYFIIESSHIVKMYREDILVAEGLIEINIFTTQLKLIDSKNRIDNFIFKSNDKDIKICCFKYTLYSTDTNIMGIGLISKNPLNKDFLDKFFDDKSLINIDQYHYKLLTTN